VQGGSLSIGGSLTGNVVATDRVDLQSGARMIGNVKAARVTIADGAQFKGNVDMDV
ncbi:MAG TPA: polymer-forming cytoskeletal protein, partial [Polyangiaceae bacterium]|nr:polymer-forming cytoskeletal protein [Polyangiaceae bacterium]